MTVSPFLSLPTGTTLPYTYKPLPTTLPPSIVDPPLPTADNNANSSQADPNAQQSQQAKPAYVQSTTSAHSAHPDDIIASCRALQTHLQKLQDDAQGTVRRWEEDIRERELAEKRRVAPGWLDAEQRMLVPERMGGTGGSGPGVAGPPAAANAMSVLEPMGSASSAAAVVSNREGEELDRAFGGMGSAQLAFRPK